MDSITQDMKFRLSLIKYSGKYGVTKAAIKYKTNRQYIYRWKRRFDGSIESLRDKSRRPHYHPNQHTEQEIKLINDMRKRNMHEGLVVFWVKLMQRGYTRSIPGLYRFLKKQTLMAVKPPNPKYITKPYEQMSYPGQRVQVDVKHVPSICLVGDAKDQKFYQYTAIDEFSRLDTLRPLMKLALIPLLFLLEISPKLLSLISNDNGFEFTKHFKSDKPSLFEKTLSELGIKHKLIRPFTPRHNGKVERSHRKDNERFYAVKSFSFDDFSKQLSIYIRRDYNNFPIRPLL